MRSPADLIFFWMNGFRNLAIIAICLFIATWLKQENHNVILVFYIWYKLSAKGITSWKYSHLYASVQNTNFVVLAAWVRTITVNWRLATSCTLVTMAITFIALEEDLRTQILISNGKEKTFMQNYWFILRYIVLVR